MLRTMTTSIPDDGPFSQSALAANASGQLSDDQRRAWRSQSRGYRKAELSFALIAVVIGALVAFAPGPAKYATIKPIIGIVCFVIAALLLVRAFTGGDRLTEDVRAGRVESVEGAITKFSRTSDSGRGSSSTSFYIDVNHIRMEAWRSQYDAAPEAGYVRVYYLPKTHRVVNLERLADPPMGEITPTSAQGALGAFEAGFRSHDEAQIAEGRAQMAAMATQFKAQMQQAAVAPPGDQRDPRPLAESIIGSWSSPFMSVTFAADGTATSTAPNGRQMSGNWSVDAQGHLHATIAGHDNVGEAWVSGTTLTISEGGRGLAFQRAG
jgi:hypothetical protein